MDHRSGAGGGGGAGSGRSDDGGGEGDSGGGDTRCVVFIVVPEDNLIVLEAEVPQSLLHGDASYERGMRAM